MKSRTPRFPLTTLVAMLLTLSLGPPMSAQTRPAAGRDTVVIDTNVEVEPADLNPAVRRPHPTRWPSSGAGLLTNQKRLYYD